VDGRSFLLPLPVGERVGVRGFELIVRLYALTRHAFALQATAGDLSPRER